MRTVALQQGHSDLKHLKAWGCGSEIVCGLLGRTRQHLPSTRNHKAYSLAFATMHPQHRCVGACNGATTDMEKRAPATTILNSELCLPRMELRVMLQLLQLEPAAPQLFLLGQDILLHTPLLSKKFPLELIQSLM